MLEWAQQADSVWQYIVLFLLAAAPWLDVFLVVPLGIVWGLSPVGVALVGFAGNFLLVLLLGLFFQQYANWREARRMKKGAPPCNRLDGGKSGCMDSGSGNSFRVRLQLYEIGVGAWDRLFLQAYMGN